MSVSFDIHYQNGEVDRQDRVPCFSDIASIGRYYFPSAIKKDRLSLINSFPDPEIRAEKLLDLGFRITGIRYYPRLSDLSEEINHKYISFIKDQLYPDIIDGRQTTSKICKDESLYISGNKKMSLVMQTLASIRYLDEAYSIVGYYNSMKMIREEGNTGRIGIVYDIIDFIKAHMVSKKNRNHMIKNRFEEIDLKVFLTFISSQRIQDFVKEGKSKRMVDEASCSLSDTFDISNYPFLGQAEISLEEKMRDMIRNSKNTRGIMLENVLYKIYEESLYE